MNNDFPKLSVDLTSRPILFRIPSWTPERIKAYQLICGQYNLESTKECRTFLEAEQNAACWGECDALSHYLSMNNTERPNQIFEIGPGMGRSTVFFKKKFGWNDVNFHLYEGNGTRITEGMLGPKSPQNFCGNIRELQKMLEFNNIQNYRIFDAKNLNYRLDNMPGPYDFIYSFYSVGFHWALEHFEEELKTLFSESSRGFFIVPDNFQTLQQLRFFDFEMIDFTAAWPANKISKMAVLRLRQ